MKKILIGLFLLICTASTAFAISYNEATKQTKPIVIMFHKHGCSACTRFSPIFDTFASKFSSKFNFIKEDIHGSQIASTLSFDTVPAFFIIQPQTKKTKRISDDCAWDAGCLTKTLQEY